MTREDARERVLRAWLAYLEASHPGTRWLALHDGEKVPRDVLGVREFPTPDRRPTLPVGRDVDALEGFGQEPPPRIDGKPGPTG